jgi:hypothetical protein
MSVPDRPRIVDVHTHVWPDAVAPRALGASIPEMPLRGDGTTAGLVAAQHEAGIDLPVCLSVANTPHQVEGVNNFAGRLDRSRFIPFGTIHPGLSPEENLGFLRAAGVVGVKVHPIFQHYRLDDLHCSPCWRRWPGSSPSSRTWALVAAATARKQLPRCFAASSTQCRTSR